MNKNTKNLVSNPVNRYHGINNPANDFEHDLEISDEYIHPYGFAPTFIMNENNKSKSIKTNNQKTK